MGIQDRDYTHERTKNNTHTRKNQIHNLKNKKLKNFLSEITVENLTFIIIGLGALLLTWKIIDAKIEENQIINITNETIKKLDKAIEEDNKKMLHFINSSNQEITNNLLKFNQTITNPNNFNPIKRQSITPTPYITYTPITPKQTTRSEICTTNIDTKERKCRFIN
jgi:hypothetical protein